MNVKNISQLNALLTSDIGPRCSEAGTKPYPLPSCFPLSAHGRDGQLVCEKKFFTQFFGPDI